MPDAAVIWITEPGRASIEDVRRFLAQPRRQAIVCRPDSGEWAEAGATVVEHIDDFELQDERYLKL